MYELQMCYAKLKNSGSKGYTPESCFYATFWKMKTIGTDDILWSPRAVGERTCDYKGIGGNLLGWWLHTACICQNSSSIKGEF